MQTIVFNVNGMSCNHCANTVKSILLEIAGVKQVKVDLAGKKVTVSTEASASKQTMMTAIEEAGYEVVL